MDTLLPGYRRFRANSWPRQRDLLRTLATEGQRPQTLIIACVDSRVDPATIFDAAPGELLIIRNVANLVPPYAPDALYHGTSAALEFGVRVLEVSQVVVLGHGQCGGVRALLDGAPANARDFVAPWVSLAEPARLRTLDEPTPEARQQACEHEVIKLTLANLMTFPWLAERVALGTLTLHGAWFAIYSGRLTVLQPDGTFAPIL